MRGPTDKAAPCIAAAILAGGRASRFGGLPKGLLRLTRGLPIIERTIDVVTAAGIEDLAIFANDPAPYQALGLQIVPDRRPGCGPLAAIETALYRYHGRCCGVLVLPCDLPGITTREVSGLQRAFSESLPPVVVAETEDGFWQPLCAVVRTDVLSAVARALDAGRRGVYRLWRELGAFPVRFRDPRPFWNINTAQDLARWLQEERRPSRAPLPLPDCEMFPEPPGRRPAGLGLTSEDFDKAEHT